MNTITARETEGIDLRRYNCSELLVLKAQEKNKGNADFVCQIEDHMAYYDKMVIVVKGNVPPVGTRGRVFWVKHYRNCTKLGVKTPEGKTWFLKSDEVHRFGS